MRADKEKQAYEYAINARNELKKDYNTWMNFFYIANAAILVAISSIKDNSNAMLFLALIGLLLAIGWFLSLRGYRYWLDNWTKILILREREYFREECVYGVFAEETKETNIFNPIGMNNISTPKVLQCVSIVVIVSWILFIGYIICSKVDFTGCTALVIGVIILSIIFLYVIVSKVLASNISFHKKIKTTFLKK